MDSAASSKVKGASDIVDQPRVASSVGVARITSSLAVSGTGSIFGADGADSSKDATHVATTVGQLAHLVWPTQS